MTTQTQSIPNSSIQNRAYDAWTRVEPYVVPGAVVAGVTLIVSQVWGHVAATCFLAVAVGVGVTFPFIVTELTKGNFYLSIAQQMIVVVMPLFGPPGVIGAAALSALLIVAKDIRIYQLRGEINSVAQKVSTYSTKLAAEIEKTKKQIDDFNKKETQIDTKLKGLETVDQNISRADKLLGEIKEKREFLDATLKEFDSKENERKEATGKKKIEIADLKKDIEETKQKVDTHIAEIEPLLQQVREALGRR